MIRPALLLAVLVLLEAVSARVWTRLPHSGSGAEREIAWLAWTGMVRVLDLVLIRFAFPRVPFGASRRAVLMAAGTAAGFGILVLAGHLAGGFPVLDALRGAPLPAYASPGPVLANLAVAVLLGPWVEEAVFRGVLLPALRERMPAWGAVLSSAALFAGFHALMGMSWPLPQLLGGLVFAWLALETGGILAGFLVHASANGFVLLLQVLAQRP